MNLVRPRSNVTRVLKDRDGSLSGLRTEHWDGRVDGLVTRPETVRLAIPASEAAILRRLREAGNG